MGSDKVRGKQILHFSQGHSAHDFFFFQLKGHVISTGFAKQQLVEIQSALGAIARSSTARHCPIAAPAQGRTENVHLSNESTSDRAIPAEVGCG